MKPALQTSLPGSLRLAVPGQLCHRELKAATTWWLPSFASGCGLRPPTASRKQESRADPDAHAAQGSPLVPHKSHLVPQHPSSVFAACPEQVTVGTQVWTLTVSEAVVGGEQRGPSGSSRRQCPLEQPLSYPSSCTGVGARDSAWPRTPATRARRPAASRLCNANRTLSGWTWDFAAPLSPGFLKQALSCSPFDSRLCKFLVVSHPRSSYTHGASCVHVTYLAHHSMLPHRHLRTFPDEKGLCRVDVDWLGNS